MPRALDAGLVPTSEQIMEEVRLVVQSKTFRRATRLKGLLEYLVRRALNGDECGQARMARDLFGRDLDFDPSLDPVIRVQLGRLRRMLSNYYSTEGKGDSVVIKLPARKYTPTFEEGASPGALERPETAGFKEENTLRAEVNSRPSIAVIPFSNLTGDPSHNSFCYGLTEEITNGLAAATSVDVVASSSSFQFKDEPVDVREVGKDLGVLLVLEGSVRVEEGHTRVIAQLARSIDGVAFWSDSFEGEMNGSINSQKSIAQKVMDGLPLDSCAGLSA